jgi:tetratricopeptide (TPR) repeat protein
LANSHRWRPDAKPIYQKALAEFTSALDLDAKNARLFQRRALVHQGLNNYEQALRDYEKAVELDPENAQLQWALANYLRLAQNPKLRDYDRAIEHAAKAVELNPDEPKFHALLAAIYVNQLNDLERARQHIEIALRLKQADPNSLRTRGRIFWKSREYELALADFSKSLELHPTVWAYKDRANVYTSLGKSEEAFADWAAAEKIDPNNVYIYEERGGMYLKLRRYEDAIREYDKATELAPHRSWKFKERARALFQLGRYAESLSDLQKAFDLNPGDLSTLVWIGPKTIATSPDEKYRQGRLNLATAAIEHPSTNKPLAYRYRAELLHAFGKPEQARQDFARATELSTESSQGPGKEN